MNSYKVLHIFMINREEQKEEMMLCTIQGKFLLSIHCLLVIVVFCANIKDHCKMLCRSTALVVELETSWIHHLPIGSKSDESIFFSECNCMCLCCNYQIWSFWWVCMRLLHRKISVLWTWWWNLSWCWYIHFHLL